MSRMESTVANPETHNFKDNPITVGNQGDSNVESNPQATNRTQKVAPMPENPGASLEEQSLSGGGSANPTNPYGSGKGGLDHEPERVKKGGKPEGWNV